MGNHIYGLNILEQDNTQSKSILETQNILCDQLGGVAAHGLPSPVADILAVLQAETEAAAEARARKRGGDLRIAHGVFCKIHGSSSPSPLYCKT